MIKNINPLFMLISSVIVFFISIYSFNVAQNNLKIQEKEYEEFKTLALKYNMQKKYWSNKKQIIKNIQKILSNSHIKNGKIIQKSKKIIVQISTTNLNTIQKFVNKVLNQRFNIIKLNIAKNKVVLEIGLVQ